MTTLKAKDLRVKRPIVKLKVKPIYYIGGHPYKIILDAEIDYEGFDGSAKHRKQEILICPNIPKSRMSEALIHEFLHIVNNVYNNHELDERTVNCIAEGLNQVFSQIGVELDWSEIKEKK